MQLRIRGEQGEAWLTVVADTCVDSHLALTHLRGLGVAALRAEIARNGWVATVIRDGPITAAILAAFPGAVVTPIARPSEPVSLL